MTPHDLSKLTRLINGSREIVNEEFLDAAGQTDYGSEIRTARNAARCGIHDQYVAWIQPSAQPADLQYKDTTGGRFAYATR